MDNLDRNEFFPQIDPEDMLGRIAELPTQCRDAWQIAQQADLPSSYSQAKQILIMGLGGSAIGGDLLRTLVADTAPVPIIVHRDYTLPAWVGPETLAIASSYSGNTEETLSAMDQAHKRGAMLLGVTTGGKLAAEAENRGFPLITFSYKAQPRAALGYSFTLLLGILQRLNFIPDQTPHLEEALQVMETWQTEIAETVPEAQNAAKQLARRLYGRMPIVYGGGILKEVARRWKGQFNENAKNWSEFEEMPELNHNAVVGYEHPATMRDHVIVLMLRSSHDHSRVQTRFRVTAEILRQQEIPFAEIHARGQSPLAQMLSTIHFGDYVSYYLAMLNDADPSPVKTIAYLKSELARS